MKKPNFSACGNSNKAAARITLFPGRKCDAQMMKNSARRHRRSGSNPFTRIVAENRNNPGVRLSTGAQERKAGRSGARHVLIGAATAAAVRQSKQRQPRGAICFAFSAAAAN
jgi:hypothetical protein